MLRPSLVRMYVYSCALSFRQPFGSVKKSSHFSFECTFTYIIIFQFHLHSSISRGSMTTFFRICSKATLLDESFPIFKNPRNFICQTCTAGWLTFSGYLSLKSGSATDDRSCSLGPSSPSLHVDRIVPGNSNDQSADPPEDNRFLSGMLNISLPSP